VSKDKKTIPTHDCPVQGKDTPYMKFVDVDKEGSVTDKTSWGCIWCMMADKMGKGL